MSKPTDYGEYYWCVETTLPKDGGEIYLYADDVMVENGDLFFMNSEGFTNMCFAHGLWKGFYVASIIDGSALAAEHWKREIPE